MTSLSAGVDNDFPDQVAATLQRNNSSKQVCAALNSSATLLAVGCSDGGVALYDFETRGVAKLLKGHTAAVVALSWNATSHHLLTASLDGLIIRWNVLEGMQGAYATMGTVSTAAASDEDGHSKRRIKSVHLHPTITDLAILNFAEQDAPMILQLQPAIPSSAQPAAASSSSKAAAASPSPAVAAADSTPSSSLEPVPRLPLWSRFISTPFVETPAQPETPATPVADLTATPAAAAGTAMSDDAASPPATAAAPDSTTPAAPSASPAASSVLSTITENAPNYTKWHATVAIWDHTGAFIFEGNTKGTVFVYQLQIDRAQLAAYRRNLPAPGQSSLPSWLHLRLVYVEARPVVRDRASRSIACSIQALVLSNCSSYLLCNFSTQLKVFRVDSALITKRSAEREATLDRMAEHCAMDLEPREIALNGARYVPSEWRSKKNKQASDAFAGMNKAQRRKAQLERDRARKQAVRAAAASAESNNNNEGGAAKASDAAAGDDDDEKDGGNAAESKSAANSDNDDDEDGPAAGGSSSTGARPSQPFLEFLRSFTDPVLRVPWRRCAFSHSSDFLVAGSQERGEHRIHIWSTHTGQLTKILLGPTEGLLDMVAHPFRSVLITTCTSGSIYIWQRKYVENWSAFAPDFEELEDNTEYVEKETEFDLVTKIADPIAEAARRAEMIIDVCKEDDDDTTGAVQESKSSVDAASTLDLPPPGSAAWMRMQLISLPTIIQPDAETTLAYQKRRNIALEIARKKKQQEIAAAQTAASAAPAAMDTEAPAATSAKRTLEEEAADEANKRARI